jgi:hypothetical protein
VKVAKATPKVADARVLRAVLKHELANAKDKGWTLDEVGMSRLVEDYFLLREFTFARGQEQFFAAVTLYGIEFLSAEDRAEYQSIKTSSREKALRLLLHKSAPYIALLWFFTVTLSHNLFAGENPISARDAYWLGLVDEVLGSDLPCERSVTEDKDNPKPNAQASSE